MKDDAIYLAGFYRAAMLLGVSSKVLQLILSDSDWAVKEAALRCVVIPRAQESEYGTKVRCPYRDENCDASSWKTLCQECRGYHYEED